MAGIKMGESTDRLDVTIPGQAESLRDVMTEDGAVSVVNLKPGDRLVLKLDHTPGPAEMQRCKKIVELWAPGIPVLVLGDGETLSVVRESE